MLVKNITSICGDEGGMRGQTAYSSSKGAVIALTKTAAKELGEFGIRVNSVAPGFIDTDMTSSLDERVKEVALSQVPLKRFGTVADIAEMTSFLCSEKASYVTGQVFTVDGGMVM
mgnify:CR=1 FL=1